MPSLDKFNPRLTKNIDLFPRFHTFNEHDLIDIVKQPDVNFIFVGGPLIEQYPIRERFVDLYDVYPEASQENQLGLVCHNIIQSNFDFSVAMIINRIHTEFVWHPTFCNLQYNFVHIIH